MSAFEFEQDAWANNRPGVHKPMHHSDAHVIHPGRTLSPRRMASCNFPHVLDRLKLKAFDLSKVIQPFVKYMPSLPR